jgi:6-phosphogluconolactonase (cycloisomerase 2 family)
VENHRSHRFARPSVAAALALSLLLGSASAGRAQAGRLTQLPRPDACTAATADGINCRVGVGIDGAFDLEVSPDGLNVYVASYGSSSVAVFVRDFATGALTQLAGTAGCIADDGDGVTCADAEGLFGASGVAVSPDGLYVYVASTVSGSLTTFARDPFTGALTQLPGADGCIAQDGGGGSPCADATGPIAPGTVLLSPDGLNVYTAAVNGNAVGVFARDPATGVLTQFPAPLGCIAEDGDGVTCTDGIALDGPRALAISKNGKHVYVASGDSDAIAVFRRDLATGALTQVAAPGGCIAENGDGITCTDAVGLDGANSVVVGKNGKHVYVASITSDAVTAFVRDPMSGALTQLPAPDGCYRQSGDGVTCTDVEGLNAANGIVATRNGRHLYVASASSGAVTAFRRDKTAGGLTQLAAPFGCYRQGGDGVTCRDGLALSGARAVAVTKSGKNVYVASYNGSSVASFLREQ